MRPHRYISKIKDVTSAEMTGQVTRIGQNYLEADGPYGCMGDLCTIEAGDAEILAEVAGLTASSAILIPLQSAASVSPGARVVRKTRAPGTPVGDSFSGRLVDALGTPLDDGPAISCDDTVCPGGKILPPLQRCDAKDILPTHISAIDALVPIGLGQRIGVFAPSGVGKTTLVKQIAAQTNIDRCVLCLVGERGREVENYWSHFSTRRDASTFTCVAATSDQSAVLRIKAVEQAIALAEYWRAQGEEVLLVIDSVTRYAMALREIGLAAGAPPTLRAYTPNVFDALPKLVERCGGAKSGGSITAIMAILTETVDADDPITETMKSLLDGHIILSRPLAERGQFPAIDISKSLSRQSEALMTENHQSLARQARAHLSVYEEAQILIESGVYKAGASQAIDRAIASREAMNDVLAQDQNQSVSLEQTLTALNAALGGQT